MPKFEGYLIPVVAELEPRRGSSPRPNGPAEPSPGLRPQADALGRKAIESSRPERPRELLLESAQLSVQVLAAFQAAGLRGLLTQGIGLRPQPWARLSRPVGPDRLDALCTQEALSGCHAW